MLAENWLDQGKDIKAYAKINLFLHIVGRLPNGYHEMESLFLFTTLHDLIRVRRGVGADKVSFDGRFSAGLDADNNSVMAILKAFKDLTGIKDLFDIRVTKNIPAGAGLGGGSVDACALLELLLASYGDYCSTLDVKKILAPIGMDALTCFDSDGCFAQGAGDLVSGVPRIDPMPILLVFPHIHISSVGAYKSFAKNGCKMRNKGIRSSLFKDGKIQDLSLLHNDLLWPAIQEAPVLSKIIANIAMQQDCSYASMSGSGSTCFGLFDNISMAILAKDILSTLMPDYYFYVGFAGLKSTFDDVKSDSKISTCHS